MADSGRGSELAEWWTFEEVQSYLGHTNHNSTEVWLSRHDIGAVRHYRADEIIAARPARWRPS